MTENEFWRRIRVGFDSLGYSSLDVVVCKRPLELAAPIRPGGERAEVLAKKHFNDALARGSARFKWTAPTDGSPPVAWPLARRSRRCRPF
jgi:hypothetical protein